MKLASIFLFTLIFATSCNSSDVEKKESELKQKELELRQRELSIQQQEINAEKIKKHEQEAQTRVKYMYVVIKTNEPKIESEKMEPLPDPLIKREPSLTTGLIPEEVQPQFQRDPVYIKYAVPKYFTYKSEVIEISNYSEDNRYIAVDKYQIQVNVSLAAANRNIQFENSYKPGESITAEAKIISKESYVFETYKEASLHRDANN